MATTSVLKDGRRWNVNSNGITALKRRYLVKLDAVTAVNGEGATFPGVPAIGSAHPLKGGLFVSDYEVEEGEGAAKNTLIVTVNYAPITTETSGSGQEQQSLRIEEWGWEGSTEERELVTAADGTAVLNSAGDAYDSVPSVSLAAPIFTKVVKFKTRQTGALSYNCKVNNADVSIGGYSFPVGSLLATVSEKRVFGDGGWKYRYTIQLKYRTNRVKLAGENTLTDIGWDVAITDAGMREKGSDGKLKIITTIDKETGKRCQISSPELLDGKGKAVARPESGLPTPYNTRYQAYERASFPAWFYSEPA